MDDGDKATIEAFAKGDESSRTAAVEAFRRCLLEEGVVEGPCMLFMSEVDNPIPDALLRAQYRKMVVSLAGRDGPAFTA